MSAIKPTVDKAMSALNDSSALIIDDRRNGGGSPETVAYFVSFLVAANHTIELSDIVSRVPKTNDFTRQSIDSQPTPVNFASIPLDARYIWAARGLRSTKFENVGMMGDEHRVSLAKGAMIVAIVLDPEGKVAGATMRPAPAGQ